MYGWICATFLQVAVQDLIRWLGPLGRMWASAIMPLHYFVLDVVVSLGFCTLLH